MKSCANPWIAGGHPGDGSQCQGVVARGFRTRLAGAVSVLALSIALGGGAARAFDDCGVVGAGGTATCNVANEAAPGAYDDADGITYQTSDLTILHSGGSAGTQFIRSGGTFSSFGTLTITSLAGASINETLGGTEAGIFASSSDGAVTITNDGSVTTNSTGVRGIALLYGYGGSEIVNSGLIVTKSNKANGIEASLSYGSGDLTIRHSGSITTEVGGIGISAYSLVGDVNVTVTGNITSMGSGVFATTSGGPGFTSLNAMGAPKITIGLDAATIAATGGGGDAGINVFAGNADVDITIGSGGIINTFAETTDGIFVFGGDRLAVQHDGTITTSGDAGKGMNLITSYGSVYVDMAGSITTSNDGASGIFERVSRDGLLSATLTTPARITTSGDFAHGIHLMGEADAFFSVAGIVITHGDGADAIRSEVSDCGSIDVAGRAEATGDGSAGIYLTLSDVNGGGFAPPEPRQAASLAPTPACQPGHAGDIVIDGFVLGGYETDSIGSRGAGISIVDPQLTFLVDPLLVDIENRGQVGALSDLAIVTDLDGARVGVDIINSGTITGVLELRSAGEDNTFTNSGLWAIRGFADSDGDGVRDTERVALSYFGGDNDLFTNQANGVISLLSSPGTDVGGAGVEEAEIRDLELLRNAGTITMADAETGFGSAVAGDRLLLVGNLESLDGVLRLDSRLDAGGPGNQLTDRFLVQGDASGTTRVFVSNAAGLGALTGTAANEGISIIQVSGQATAKSFVLGGQVVGGAYLYELNAFDPAASDDSEIDPRLGSPDFWDFRLQSTGRIFAGTSEYPLIGLAAQQLFWTDLDVLHRRMGELRVVIEDPFRYQVQPGQAQASLAGQEAAAGASDGQVAVRPGAGPGGPEGAWVKGYGSEFEIAAGSGFGQDTYGGIAGYDLGVENAFSDGDMLLFGPTLGIAGSRVKFNGSASTLALDVYRFGGYAVYFDGPFYLDGVAKVDWADGTFVAPASSTRADVTRVTAGVSLETGYTYMLDAANFVEPQLQLAYSHTWGDDFRDGAGVEVTLDDNDSLIGRLGVRAGTVMKTGGRGRFAPYLQASVLHEFLGESAASVSDLTFDASLEGTSYEVGIGAHAADLASNLSVYTDLLYRFGHDVQGVKGLVGLRYSW